MLAANSFVVTVPASARITSGCLVRFLGPRAAVQAVGTRHHGVMRFTALFPVPLHPGAVNAYVAGNGSVRLGR